MEKDAKNSIVSEKYLVKSSSSISTCHVAGTDELTIHHDNSRDHQDVLTTTDNHRKSDFSDILWLTGC